MTREKRFVNMSGDMMPGKPMRKFNRKHPPEWWEGYNCREPKMRNPYHKGSEQFDEWLDGWECRFYGEKP